MKRKILLFFLLTLSFNVFSRECPIAKNVACIDRTKGNTLVPMLLAKQPTALIIKTNQGTYEITKPGLYKILENITGTKIVIKSNDVILDLNNFTVTADGSIITVERPGSDPIENIVIKNGSLRAKLGTTPDHGILVKDGLKSVRIDNMKIFDCVTGLYFKGFYEEEVGTALIKIPNPIECCKVTNCLITGCTQGVQMEYANKNIFESIDVCHCGYAGFLVGNCNYNKFKQCKAIDIGPGASASNVAGFTSWAGLDNLFYECMTERVYKDDVNGLWCTKAIGFWFNYDFDSEKFERESKIINCTVDSVSAAGLSNAYGISLGMLYQTPLDPTDPFIQVALGQDPPGEADVVAVDMSPSDDYVAISNATYVEIYKFDRDAKLRFVSRVEPNGSAIVRVKWSPTGEFLAVGTEEHGNTATDGELYIYKFDLNTGRLIFVTSQELADGAEANYRVSLSLDWNRKGTELLVTKYGDNSSRVFKYFFDGVVSNPLVERESLVFTAQDELVARFSPDDKYVLVTAYNGTTGDVSRLYRNTEFGLQWIKEIDNTNNVLYQDIAWCSVACCGKYYFALVGNVGVNAYLELFEFDVDSNNTSLLQPIPFGADSLYGVEWAPNGKKLAAMASARIKVYDVDLNKAYETPPANPLTALQDLTYTGITFSDANVLVWSKSGKYLMIGGVSGETSNFVMYKVADTVERCVVENTKIANVLGGLCGIGIIGSGAWNLIDQNVLFGSCINASTGIYNTFFDFKKNNSTFKSKALDNLAFESGCC